MRRIQQHTIFLTKMGPVRCRSSLKRNLAKNSKNVKINVKFVSEHCVYSRAKIVFFTLF